MKCPAVVLMLACLLMAATAQAGTHADWPMFGWSIGRGGAPDVAMGITPDDLHALRRQQVRIDGTVDAAAIYLHAVTVAGARHDVFFVTTTYGKTLAIDADTGHVLWEFTPPDYASLAGTYRVTNATPVADPNRRSIYAAAPDGMVRKLAVADGRVEWSTPITRLPAREKIAGALGVYHGKVLAVTNGYNGDAPPYQGHVALLDAQTGKLLHVWNALCSDREALLDPRTCRHSDAGIWGRAGAVVDAASGDIFVATGNGPWDGLRNWGDAVIELDPDATRVLGNYTPADTAALDRDDADLGSSSPVLTGGPYLVQGGKDGILHLLDWRRMRGTTPHRDGAAARIPTPGHARLFTSPAVWHHAGATWIFVADGDGTAAWTLQGAALRPQWHNDHAGTSPVVADGMLFVYDPAGGLHVYAATSGRQLDVLACGDGHWSSPIVVDGRIALPEGNANARRTQGVLDIWRLPVSR